MEFFRRTGIVPDVIIGDFDSVNADTLDFFKKKNDIEWTKLNPVKDDTDTEAAIRLAIEKGAQSITLLGATGSRIDHVLANIELLGIGLRHKVQMKSLQLRTRYLTIRQMCMRISDLTA